MQTMRPNIDVPWAVHGRIKDRAEDSDRSLTEEYVHLLELALDSEVTECQ